MNIKKVLDDFNTIARGRNWQHLHTPKNLAMAIAVESSELLRWFQWLPEVVERQYAELDPNREHVAAELADIIAYTLVLSQKLDIDIEEAINKKMLDNRKRFLSADGPEHD